MLIEISKGVLIELNEIAAVVQGDNSITVVLKTSGGTVSMPGLQAYANLNDYIHWSYLQAEIVDAAIRFIGSGVTEDWQELKAVVDALDNERSPS